MYKDNNGITHHDECECSKCEKEGLEDLGMGESKINDTTGRTLMEDEMIQKMMNRREFLKFKRK